jgi:metallo-beta-lactamase class B
MRLASHASQFDLQKKHKPGDAYNPAVFIDHKGYDAAIASLQQAYQKKLGSK